MASSSYNIPTNLSEYEVSSGVPRVYYIPDFISIEEEEYLLRQINNAPKPKWKNLANRRLQVWGGDLTSSGKLLAQPLPDFLTKYPDIIGKLVSTGAFSESRNKAPNHVIINEYQPNQGIMPHEDGPAYYPLVGTISLGSHTVFHYYRYKDIASRDKLSSAGKGPGKAKCIKNTSKSDEDAPRNSGRVIDISKPVLSLLLEPRSLVITTDRLYTDHLHGIDETTEDNFMSHSTYSSVVQQETEGGPNLREETQMNALYVANWRMIRDKRIGEVLENGGKLKRGTRMSLTCRDVENSLIGGLKSFRR